MEITKNGNVNHVTILVPNVPVLLIPVVPNVQEIFTIMKEHVLLTVQMDITKIPIQTLVIHVMKNV